MLKQLNIKKEYGLVAGSILLLLIAYQFDFKRTIEAWQLHRDLKQQAQQSGDLSYQPGYLERKNRNLDKILSFYKADTLSFRSNELSKIASIAEQADVKLSEVPSEDRTYSTAQSVIQKLSLEGDYFELVKTLRQLESASGIGFIRSVKLNSTRKHQGNDNERKMVMQVYINLNAR
jgi:hypothetical protein